MPVKLRKSFTKPTDEYQILFVVLTEPTTVAIQKIRSIIGERRLNAQERVILENVFSDQADAVINSIYKGA